MRSNVDLRLFAVELVCSVWSRWNTKVFVDRGMAATQQPNFTSCQAGTAKSPKTVVLWNRDISSRTEQTLKVATRAKQS